MKVAIGLSLCLFAVNAAGQAQTIDYDKRNMHIFCSSHLALLSESLEPEGDGYQALTYLAGIHRNAARQLKAEPKHFTDVTRYLNHVRSNDPQKWDALSAQSERVCLPDS